MILLRTIFLLVSASNLDLDLDLHSHKNMYCNKGFNLSYNKSIIYNNTQLLKIINFSNENKCIDSCNSNVDCNCFLLNNNCKIFNMLMSNITLLDKKNSTFGYKDSSCNNIDVQNEFFYKILLIIFLISFLVTTIIVIISFKNLKKKNENNNNDENINLINTNN